MQEPIYYIVNNFTCLLTLGEMNLNKNFLWLIEYPKNERSVLFMVTVDYPGIRQTHTGQDMLPNKQKWPQGNISKWKKTKTHILDPN